MDQIDLISETNAAGLTQLDISEWKWQYYNNLWSVLDKELD